TSVHCSWRRLTLSDGTCGVGWKSSATQPVLDSKRLHAIRDPPRPSDAPRRISAKYRATRAGVAAPPSRCAPAANASAACPFPACPAPRCSSTDSFPHERGSASQPRSGDRSWGQLRGVSGPREALQGRGGNKAQQPMNTAIPDRKHASPLIPAPIPSLHGNEGVGGSSPPEGFIEKKSPEIGDVCCLAKHHRAPPHELGTAIALAARARSACKRTCCPAPRSTSLARRARDL